MNLYGKNNREQKNIQNRATSHAMCMHELSLSPSLSRRITPWFVVNSSANKNYLSIDGRYTYTCGGLSGRMVRVDFNRFMGMSQLTTPNWIVSRYVCMWRMERKNPQICRDICTAEATCR